MMTAHNALNAAVFAGWVSSILIVWRKGRSGALIADWIKSMSVASTQLGMSVMSKMLHVMVFWYLLFLKK